MKHGKLATITLLLLLPSCTIVHKHYEFSIRTIDPPLEPSNHITCIPVGYDGLACEDEGLHI